MFANLFSKAGQLKTAPYQARGFRLLFLPKFHCELNFIEQCWGYAKRIYRLNPESSRDDNLEKYAIEALDSIPLETIRRYVLCLWFGRV